MHFSDILIGWYLEYKRNLPWRNTKSPYKIWLSEIILQQTRVAQGLNYYEKFIEQYPTVQDLAKAKEDDVLKLWQGLGYYSRARNLHYTAKYISNELNDVFPNNYKELLKLKGVGSYTAAAIASFCYNEPVAVVDGNVYRVLSRYFNLDSPIDSTNGKKLFWDLANECLNKNIPAEHNQAIMEFGALQCTPKPNCEICPLKDSCVAFNNNVVANLPVKEKKVKITKRYFNFIVISDLHECYIEKRTANDIWGNLYQFPLIVSEKECSSPTDFTNDMLIGATFVKVSKQFKHVLSHQLIFAKFWEYEIDTLPVLTKYKSIKKSTIQEYAIPRLIEKYLESV